MSLAQAKPEAKRPAGRRLVWFSEVQWDFLSTRKQRLLARFPENWRILFIEPFALGRPNHWIPVRRGRVVVVGIPFLKRVPFRFGRLLDVRLIRHVAALPGVLLLHFWLMLLGFAGRRRIVGLSNLYWAKAVSRLSSILSFYDANDDHLAFPGTPSWLRPELRRWLGRVGLVFSVSRTMTGRLLLPPSVRVVTLGNGVEFSHFAEPRSAVPEPFRESGGPILGYAGAMDWLDVPLLVRTAAAWPDCRIELVGPAYEHGWWERQSELRALGNVRWHGRVAYAELPSWMQRFDLGLLPLERSELKRASNPNKLYEYAAAGVPVLALNYCDAVDDARGEVMVADTEDEFVRMVPMALRDGRRELRQAFARRHSWDRLASEMVDELERSIREARS
ncbi:glycosyltransferase [Chlorobium sp. N1]|uniref:glycosyltransferase family protein n=1 Tax=Chlorobium sp. N1 TaxID=2491138 RepID=UPI00103DCADD|nr:glycosyltransferase [Chlorobium sp. N1]TCD47752.1 glycosyltransferase family 1 protein [Chlorobium sp. N1]